MTVTAKRSADMKQPEADPVTPPVVVGIFVSEDPERFLPALRSLTTLLRYPIVLGSDRPSRLGAFGDLAANCVQTWSAATFVNDLWREWQTSILAVTDPVLVPEGFLDRSLGFLAADCRISTVSFLSNSAEFLSFPHRNQPTEKPEAGHDATSVTRLLRQVTPDAGPVPIPFAAGGAILLSSTALATVGLLENASSGAFEAAVADFSCRGRERGLVDVLDAGTYCVRFSDLSIRPTAERAITGLTLDDNGWLHQRHPMVNPLLNEERAMEDSALGLGLRTARAKVHGVRVLIDGSCIGPQEMGTQVATTALVAALADNSEVSEVCVALPGPVPPYAQVLTDHPKIRAEAVLDGDLGRFGPCDIAHRPYQPNDDFDIARWRAAANRIMVTIHDLIAFHIGTYSRTQDAWLRYRGVIRRALREVDGVVVISDDVARHLAAERLPVDGTRVFIVPNGTEHLTGDEEARPPEEMVRRNALATEFLLCLGTDYTHKNRDHAIGAYVELRRRGWEGHLVLVGPAVPWGSSRAREAGVALKGSLDGHSVITLPDLPHMERNWLLRHAAVVLYPTSAEGFGLVPFEAARFGTPTVNVGFGPLTEVGGDQPVTARDWSPRALADATERLLQDPELADRQIEACLAAGSGFTWTRAAGELAASYRLLLAGPRR